MSPPILVYVATIFSLFLGENKFPFDPVGSLCAWRNGKWRSSCNRCRNYTRYGTTKCFWHFHYWCFLKKMQINECSVHSKHTGNNLMSMTVVPRAPEFNKIEFILVNGSSTDCLKNALVCQLLSFLGQRLWSLGVTEWVFVEVRQFRHVSVQIRLRDSHYQENFCSY